MLNSQGYKSNIKNTLFQNWTDARSFCNANGMRLATIKSEQQRNSLSNAAWVLPNGMMKS